MRAPYSLAPDKISTETVQCLEELLAHARNGEVIGLAFAAILKKRHYIVNSAGEAFRNPTFARGIVAALDDQLSLRVGTGSKK